MRKIQKRFALIVLVLAFVLALAACGDSKAAPVSDGTEKTFTLLVVDDAGAETRFTVTTAAVSVGAALEADGLIDGEMGPYGYYIKTVNGLTKDYDKDGQYWAFYVGDSYATAGVDQTEIEDGATYALKVE